MLSAKPHGVWLLHPTSKRCPEHLFRLAKLALPSSSWEECLCGSTVVSCKGCTFVIKSPHLSSGVPKPELLLFDTELYNVSGRIAGVISFEDRLKACVPISWWKAEVGTSPSSSTSSLSVFTGTPPSTPPPSSPEPILQNDTLTHPASPVAGPSKTPVVSPPSVIQELQVTPTPPTKYKNVDFATPHPQQPHPLAQFFTPSLPKPSTTPMSGIEELNVRQEVTVETVVEAKKPNQVVVDKTVKKAKKVKLNDKEKSEVPNKKSKRPKSVEKTKAVSEKKAKKNDPVKVTEKVKKADLVKVAEEVKESKEVPQEGKGKYKSAKESAYLQELHRPAKVPNPKLLAKAKKLAKSAGKVAKAANKEKALIKADVKAAATDGVEKPRCY